MKKKQIQINRWFMISIMIVTIHILFTFNIQGTGDITTHFCKWIANAIENGLKNGYKLNNDYYPPLSSLFMYLPAIMLKVKNYFSCVKIMIGIFELLSVIIFAILFDCNENLLGFTLSILLSCQLSYIDIFMIPFFLLAVYFFIHEKNMLFTLFFGLCVCVKYQPLIFLPIWMLAFVEIDKKRISVKWNELKKMIVPFLCLCIVMIFGWGWFEIVRSLGKSLLNAADLLCGNALNFLWIVQFFVENNNIGNYGELNEGRITNIWAAPQELLALRFLFWIIFFGIIIVILKRKNFSRLYLLRCSILAYLAYYIFNVGVHENHLFVAMVLAWGNYCISNDKEDKFLAICCTLVFNFNLIVFYGLTGQGIERVLCGVDLSVLIALANIILFIFLFIRNVCVRKLD